MNLIIIYRLKSNFFIAGTFSCPVIKTEDKITLKIERAKYEDKIFIEDHATSKDIQKKFSLKDFYPIKTYFKYEGYNIDDASIDDIKDMLGGAESIWVNFQDSTV